MWGDKSLYNVKSNNAQSQVETSYIVGGIKSLDKIESLIVLVVKSESKVENETCDSWGQ